MKVLVTAGNTQVPIDQVRCITSVFSGRTGASLALHAHQRGHHVTLLTSHPEVVAELADSAGLAAPSTAASAPRWRCLAFRTFDDLENLMEQNIAQAPQDAIIASAAVSDFRPQGIFAPAAGTYFAQETGAWNAATGLPTLEDRSAGKVKSNEPEIWLRLVAAPKLIDRVRSAWGFRGLLVKFKLEVGLTSEQLIVTAERSRQQSAADFIVANLYDGALSSFFVGPISAANGQANYQRIARRDLPQKLFDFLEAANSRRS